eukprot:Nk52_evm89s1810 gene=Nk52_evmTU89s1810
MEESERRGTLTESRGSPSKGRRQIHKRQSTVSFSADIELPQENQSENLNAHSLTGFISYIRNYFSPRNKVSDLESSNLQASRLHQNNSSSNTNRSLSRGGSFASFLGSVLSLGSLNSKGSNLSLNSRSTELSVDPDLDPSLRPYPKDFRNTTWNELRHNEIKSSELKAPRIRDGPRSSDQEYISPPHTVFQPDRRLNYFSRKAQSIKHKAKAEDWENCFEVNLAYQELGDSYQKRKLKEVIKKLYRCNRIFLGHNLITDQLRGLHLPSLTELYLQGNCISSFSDLPIMPHIRKLNLEENDIADTKGSKKFESSLEELVLEGNPISFEYMYRKRIRDTLPKLKVLDGTVCKEESDMETCVPNSVRQSSWTADANTDLDIEEGGLKCAIL